MKNLPLLNMVNADFTVSVPRPLIMAGPCSAETEDQLLATARQIALHCDIDIFRAGIWKPRTRPGSFEGIGKIGLTWLKEVKEIIGKPVAVEVANTAQVEEALKQGIDILWIGARTTVNPFSVQDIADALRGVRIPVFVKNPLNPDIDLWTGAVERVLNAGIEWVGLIHRGFSSFGNSHYRNPPMWHLAIEMKQRHPGLTMLNDPSHICGNRENIQETLQYAADLGYDGAMVEVHCNPDKAWSDAKQQLLPQDFGTLIRNIRWRDKKLSLDHDQLLAYREQIDQLDDELLSLLGRRMQISQQIGEYKSQHNISILQLIRWSEILHNVSSKGHGLGLSEDFISQYINAIHLESIRHQEMKMHTQSQEEE